MLDWLDPSEAGVGSSGHGAFPGPQAFPSPPSVFQEFCSPFPQAGQGGKNSGSIMITFFLAFLKCKLWKYSMMHSLPYST